MLNTLQLGDALELIKKIDDKSVDTIITDPPYGIAKKKPLSSTSHGKMTTLEAEWDIFPTKESYEDFTEQWIKQAHRVLKDTGIICVWGSRVSIFITQPILQKYFPTYIDLFTWIKHDSPPNMTQRGLAASTEFCLIYSKGTSKWTFNHDVAKKYNNGKQMRNYMIMQRSMNKKERTSHPTQKKIETQKFLVETFSNKGEIVLDLFAGSGTTLVACIETQRNFHSFEKNAKYYIMAKERLEDAKIQNTLF